MPRRKHAGKLSRAQSRMISGSENMVKKVSHCRDAKFGRCRYKSIGCSASCSISSGSSISMVISIVLMHNEEICPMAVQISAACIGVSLLKTSVLQLHAKDWSRG
ncbi:hypothetical protein FIBSPDRAFT_865278 [Athelia psychrophila]|uniref:Uncharacterized protein n=1 Tax=Athelia psychrophila TaxID=1759441 RepID=A0A166FSP3_9AGAM|nr:hypothetical protein FIBSPDRAFT_865278 [Fibularhizoctonia sp. CBS 109695]